MTSSGPEDPSPRVFDNTGCMEYRCGLPPNNRQGYSPLHLYRISYVGHSAPSS